MSRPVGEGRRAAGAAPPQGQGRQGPDPPGERRGQGGKPLTDTEQAAFLDYCRQDVEVLRELDRRLPELTGADRRMFELTRTDERPRPADRSRPGAGAERGA